MTISLRQQPGAGQGGGGGRGGTDCTFGESLINAGH